MTPDEAQAHGWKIVKNEPGVFSMTFEMPGWKERLAAGDETVVEEMLNVLRFPMLIEDTDDPR